MANTYTSLYHHIVFSTKNRQRWIQKDIEQRIWEYMGGVARQNAMSAIKIGGVEDHVHVLLKTPPTIAPSKAVQLIKGTSSKWIHETFASLGGFAWQDGYGAFSVSSSQLPRAIEYIKGQREHHRLHTFQDEYRGLLERHGIEYAEQYLWG